MYGALDVSTSGLLAQRTRVEVAAGNIARKDAILNAQGEYEPYRRRQVVLGAAARDPDTGTPAGVRVAEIRIDTTTELSKRYEPGSPYADPDGYVAYPNVNPVVEQVNAMEASRSYEANIAAIEATKSMMSVALELLA